MPKTSFHRVKFLIVRIPTSVIANFTFDFSREEPTYDEFTDPKTWPAGPGFDSVGTANSAGPFVSSRDSSKSRIVLRGSAGY